jgi:hypothetical protein
LTCQGFLCLLCVCFQHQRVLIQTIHPLLTIFTFSCLLQLYSQ